MANCILAGGGSTNSRGHRPLPPGAVIAVTECGYGVYETEHFEYDDGDEGPVSLLSWVIGQHGCLWSNGPFPHDIEQARCIFHGLPGAYGHIEEYKLAALLGDALDGCFTSDNLSARFGLSGRDPLDAAARIARAATGRAPLASYGYHGTGEAWIHPPYPDGIPEVYKDLAHRFEWGDVVRVRALARECAAVCVEVPALDDDAAIAEFLGACRKACDDGGAIFVVDEVVSGFRFGIGGACRRYGVKADICAYGKAMNAFGKVSAIVGRADLVGMLDGRVFFSQTFGGDPQGCAEASATIRYLLDHQGEVYGHLHEIGTALKSGLLALGIPVIGQPERSTLAFKTDAEWLAFCRAMIGRGVMVHRPFFPTMSHALFDVARTLEAAAEVMKGAA